jgi:hypothetical protein
MEHDCRPIRPGNSFRNADGSLRVREPSERQPSDADRKS